MSIRFESQCIYTVCEMHYLHPPILFQLNRCLGKQKLSLCTIYISAAVLLKDGLLCAFCCFPMREQNTNYQPHIHTPHLPFLVIQSTKPQKKTPTPSLLKKQDVQRKTEGERGIKKEKKSWSCVLSLSRPGRIGALPWFSMKAALIPGTSAAAQHSRWASSFLGKI